jgi:hypothetical protein
VVVVWAVWVVWATWISDPQSIAAKKRGRGGPQGPPSSWFLDGSDLLVTPAISYTEPLRSRAARRSVHPYNSLAAGRLTSVLLTLARVKARALMCIDGQIVAAIQMESSGKRPSVAENWQPQVDDLAG